jgi:hypothetical protein
MSGPHDQLSRRTFTLPAEAVAELRLALPAEVVALLDWSTLHVESEIVIDPGLKETESDIVYSIRLLTGQQAYILVLFEHLSSPDRWVPLRLLNYMVRYLLRWRELHPKSQLLPAIFPVVLYTGAKQEWNAPPRLEELFDLPGEGEALERLRSHTVRMSYRLDNIHPARTEELLARPAPPFSRLVLFFSRYATTPQFPRELPKVTGLLALLQASPEGAKHLVTLLAYLARLTNQRPYKATKEVLYSLAGAQQAEALMKSVAEELTEKARVEERTKVRVETQVEERAKYILKILAGRGVHVSSRARQRILSCRDPDTLDRWLTRAVHATSTAEVFDKLPQ